LGPDSSIVKCLSDTRWEAHAKATSAIADSYGSIVDALYHTNTNDSEKGDMRRKAGILQETLED
jgi:hypothetical protein